MSTVVANLYGEPPAARTRMFGGLFSDRNLERLSYLLDDRFRIPGTPVHVGLDGIMGLIPFAGDILSGLTSGVIVAAAWTRGVPYVTLARMAANVALEVGIGAIPILGDAFDIAWKANRRNYRLLTRHLRSPHRHTWKDYAFLLGLMAALLAILAIPVLAVIALGVWFARRV